MPVFGALGLFPGYDAIKVLERNIWKNKEEVMALQIEKLQKLLNHCYETVPYYRDIFNEIGIKPEDIRTVDDLKRLPVLTREIIRNNYPHAITSDKFNEASVLKKSSSGSTGEPLRRYTTRKAVFNSWTSIFRCWQWMGFDFGKRVLQVWGDKEYQKKYSGIRKIGMALMRWDLIPCYCVDLKQMPETIKKIKKHKPNLIRGYTPSLDTIAMYMELNSIDDIRPDFVITTGATLTGKIRERLEKVFQCKVYDEYGADGMVIGFQCPQCGQLHTLDDNIIFEFDHYSGVAKSAGENIAEIVVTDLNNYAMPLIRYKVGDLYIPAGKKRQCNTGFGAFDSVIGRTTDRIVVPDGKVIIYFDFIFEGIADMIEKYQIIQEDESTLMISVVPCKKITLTPAHQEMMHNTINKNLTEFCGSDLNVKLIIRENINTTGTWKRRHIVSKLYHAGVEKLSR